MHLDDIIACSEGLMLSDELYSLGARLPLKHAMQLIEKRVHLLTCCRHHCRMLDGGVGPFSRRHPRC